MSSIIGSIQRGIVTIPSGSFTSQSVDITISEVNVNKAFIKATGYDYYNSTTDFGRIDCDEAIGRCSFRARIVSSTKINVTARHGVVGEKE